MQQKKQYSGIIAWFAQNHVAANLLMAFFLLGGYLILGVMNREIFPSIDPKIINVTVPYPGASPEDVEEGITQRVEEAVLAVDGIKRISSVAAENMGNVMLELEEYADPNDVYNEVRDEVGRLVDFPPQNAENVIIQRVKPKSSLMQLALSGDVSEEMLHDYAEHIEQDLRALPKINDVIIRGGRSREITIEISSETLEKYNLTHNDVANIVRNSSQNIPAGRLETSAGDILLRVQEKRYFANEYANIVIRALPDGTVLKLKDIATLIDGFDDSNLRYEYNGKPSLTISVTRNANQDVIEMEDQINDYLQNLSLPHALHLDIKKNSTDPLKDRTNLMINNALGGFVLLFICLLLFLDLKLAFWISMGVPISFMGGLMIAYFVGVNINMITLFALIVVIGVVVDDAIIIGESIFYEQENPKENDGPYDAVIRGVKNVIAPATVGVLTTIIAFVPLLLTTGTFGQILRVIPIVVISILFLSLIEAYFILPAHLAKPSRWSGGIVKEWQKKIDRKFQNFTNNILVPFVKITMHYRYATMMAVICFIAVGVMAITSGQIRVVFFPVIEGTQVTATLEMPMETSFEETEKNAENILKAAHKTIQHYEEKTGSDVYENIAFSVGDSSSEAGPGGGGSSASGNHLARIDIELVGSDDRAFSGLEFERLWRKNTGQISGARSLEFQSSLIRSGDDLNIELAHKNADMLSAASEYLRNKIAKIEGVTTIKESLELGKNEYHFTPTAAGYAAGLTPSSLALSIRSAFNGIEVTRVQRGRSEVRVMVRLPENQRATRETLNDLRIKLPNGTRAALTDMADITIERGYSLINRTEGRRIIALLGDIDETVRTTDEVTATIEADYIPEMKKRFPGIEYSYEGKAKERADDVGSLKANTLLAIFIIFALLAVQLKGYVAPFVIIANIPLGVIGAVYAHWILGHDLSFMSVFGIVALCGVVVNDSVVLIDYYNRMREEGMSEFDALAASAKRRFRAILLTTLTNGFSTLPILLETSTQAQFLIPMAISLSCGIFFSTALLFVFTPSLMHIIKDIEDLLSRIKRKFA